MADVDRLGILNHDPMARRGGPRLQLIGEFELWDRGTVTVPHGVQRFLAFLALAGGPVGRYQLGGALWGDTTQDRADGNLRSTLWRLGRLRGRLVERRTDRLAIAPGVRVDVVELSAVARRILAPDAPDAEATGPAAPATTDLADAAEILPGWDDLWLMPERERYRQLRLHALERAAERSLQDDECARAIELGLTIVEAEPFRESGHRLLIAAHLREGNAIEAVRQYRTYRRLAADELGVDPSPRMETLIEPIRGALGQASTGSASFSASANCIRCSRA
jgi:DNA-binding SARP family transcriptional activator